jgi:flagellar motor switch protein FliG
VKITNEKHAAVILKCLPRKTADRFLSSLDHDSCSNIVRLMKQVEVTTENLQVAISLLEREGLGCTQSLPQGNAAVRIQSGTCENLSHFAFLLELDDSVLLRLFSEEQSRSTALILSTLPQEFASKILKDCRPTKRVEIIRHIASLSDPEERELIELRFALRLRVQKLLKDSVGSVETQTDTGDEALTAKQQAESTLHDLAKLSDKQIKKLLKRIDTSHLAPALKILPIQLQRKVLRNMASKPAAIVTKEIVDIRIDEEHRIERSSRSVARAIAQLKTDE